MRRLLLLGLAAAGLAIVLKRRAAAGAADVPPFAPPAPTAPVPPAPRPDEPVEQETAAQEEVAAEPTIKGNRSGKYHTPESPYYARTKAEQWFATREEAEAAGYVAWDANR